MRSALQRLLCLGMCLLDVGLLMARELAKARGVPPHTLWVDIRTHRRLRDLAGSVAVACWCVEGPLNWSALTERSLEKRFGRLRICFPSGQMSAADYFRASAKVMREEVHRYEQQAQGPELPEEQKLSGEQFSQIADEAFAAAIKLASMCSKWTQKELRALCNISPDPTANDDFEDPEDKPAGGPSFMITRMWF